MITNIAVKLYEQHVSVESLWILNYLSNEMEHLHPNVSLVVHAGFQTHFQHSFDANVLLRFHLSVLYVHCQHQGTWIIRICVDIHTYPDLSIDIPEYQITNADMLTNTESD